MEKKEEKNKKKQSESKVKVRAVLLSQFCIPVCQLSNYQCICNI